MVAEFHGRSDDILKCLFEGLLRFDPKQTSDEYTNLIKGIPQECEKDFEEFRKKMINIPKYIKSENDYNDCSAFEENVDSNISSNLSFEEKYNKICSLYEISKKKYIMLRREKDELEEKQKYFLDFESKYNKTAEDISDLTNKLFWEQNKRKEIERIYNLAIEESENEEAILKEYEKKISDLLEDNRKKSEEIDDLKNTMEQLKTNFNHYMKIHYDESEYDGAINSVDFKNINKATVDGERLSDTIENGGERLSHAIIKGVSTILSNKENEQPNNSANFNNSSIQSPNANRQREAINYLDGLDEERRNVEKQLEQSNQKINELETENGNLKRSLDLEIKEKKKFSGKIDNLEVEIDKVKAERDNLIKEKIKMSQNYENCVVRRNELEIKLKEALHEKEQIPNKLNELNETLNELATKVNNKNDSTISEEYDEKTGKLIFKNMDSDSDDDCMIIDVIDNAQKVDGVMKDIKRNEENNVILSDLKNNINGVLTNDYMDSGKCLKNENLKNLIDGGENGNKKENQVLNNQKLKKIPSKRKNKDISKNEEETEAQKKKRLRLEAKEAEKLQKLEAKEAEKLQKLEAKEAEKAQKDVARIRKEMAASINTKAEQYLYCNVSNTINDIIPHFNIELENFFESRDIKNQIIFEDSFTSAVTWKRKNVDALVENNVVKRLETFDNENIFILIMSGGTFKELYNKNTLINEIKTIKNQFSGEVQGVVIVYEKHSINKAPLYNLCLQVFEETGSQLKFIKTAEKVILTIAQHHRAIAKKPLSLQKEAETMMVYLGEKGVKEGDEIHKDWWYKMLSGIHRISEDQRRAIIDHYANPFKLIKLLREIGTLAGVKRISNIQCDNGRKIGPAFAQKLVQTLTSITGDEVIEC
uniref:Crossover junction endonuclease MUS81 n=1 Tax=Parastrongyloides trichosuri TaxID=131310 RepID=A0A0N4ZET4_PARTI